MEIEEAVVGSTRVLEGRPFHGHLQEWLVGQFTSASSSGSPLSRAGLTFCRGAEILSHHEDAYTTC
jgi:hypothetical protein